MCVSLIDWLTNETHHSVYNWSEDECAIILFTSGSTGIPKGVCHSLGNMLRSAKLFIEHFNIQDNDHLYCIAPMHSMSGIRSLLLPLVSDLKVTMADDKHTFMQMMQYIIVNKPSIILCGPVFIKALALYGKRLIGYLQGVHTILCTGCSLSHDDRVRVIEIHHVLILNYYGLTETGGIVLAERSENTNEIYLPPECKNTKVILTPLENTRDIFNLSIQSPNIFLGYLGEKLKRRVIFDTGDLVQRLPNQKLIFLGRHSRATKGINSEWIFPNLLEKWLKNRNEINDAIIEVKKTEQNDTILEAMIDTDLKEPNEYFKLIHELIINELGIEYRIVKWKLVDIIKNNLGKVDKIIPRFN